MGKSPEEDLKTMNTQTTTPEQTFGYDVIDNSGNKIGTVDNVWVDDATGQLEFVGVKTGWLFGKTHVIPAENANIADGSITVPYGQDQIKDAPTFGSDDEISPSQENDIYQYYGMNRTTDSSPTGLAQGGGDFSSGTTSTQYTGNTDTGYTGTTNTGYGDTDTRDMQLSEEELQVGKRQVEAGQVRLRKVVHTEHKEVPVDLRREQVSVERVPASDTNVPSNAFEGQEINVPVMQEEPVVAKEAHVTGGVRLNRDVQTETRTVGGDVRREDVEVEDDSGMTDNSTDTTRY